MDKFSDVAKAAWSTDDGKTTFCVPMASVIHGFIYNKASSRNSAPHRAEDEGEFHAVLDKIKKDGTYTPRSTSAPPTSGKRRRWASRTSARTTGRAKTGRKALIAGNEKFTDKQYVDMFTELATWAPYMANGFQAQKYPDSQNLFSLGKAAIYPAGSWDISTFRSQAQFPWPRSRRRCPTGEKTATYPTTWTSRWA